MFEVAISPRLNVSNAPHAPPSDLQKYIHPFQPFIYQMYRTKQSDPLSSSRAHVRKIAHENRLIPGDFRDGDEQETDARTRGSRKIHRHTLLVKGLEHPACFNCELWLLALRNESYFLWTLKGCSGRPRCRMQMALLIISSLVRRMVIKKMAFEAIRIFEVNSW